MKIESMDAAKIMDRTVQKPVHIDNSQKTAPIENEGRIIPDEARGTPVSEKFIINAIEKANRAMVSANRELEFSVHEATKEIMVKVIDTETKEVVREIPSEKILDMVANILEMAGILVDERR